MPPKPGSGSKKKAAYVPAPAIKKDKVAFAARNRPAVSGFSNVATANLLPLLGAGIHAVSTESSGLLCGLYGLIYSYCAARDLAAPEGKPIPLADNPTAKELIAFRKSPGFWEEALAYVTTQFGAPLRLFDDEGVTLGKANILEQVKLYVPDNPDNYEIPVLHTLLSYLNKRYGTHYILGHVVQGFNVRWDVKGNKWDIEFQNPTQDQDVGTGVEPILWLYNDNSESIEFSLHHSETFPDIGGHWMGLSTLHRDLDQAFIELTNEWFGDAVDAYLEKDVWIVTADIEGYQVDLEDHQDIRELRLFAGCFITEPKVDPALDAEGNTVKNAPEIEWVAPEDAPVGYMWAQTGPIVDGKELPGNVGIVPLQRVKRIEKDCLRKAHDASGATATNIIKKIAVSEEGDGLWAEFFVYRTIEPTFKIDRKYANPKNPAKKFVGGFTFEDSEFLLDQQEPLKDHCLRMTKMDGTSGRVKPRNLQQIEEAWGLPRRLPVEASGTRKKQTSAPRTSSDKTSPKYQYKPGINGKDFAIKILRQHCQARGYVAKEYGKTKQSMLDLLIRHDEGQEKQIESLLEGEPSYGLPMRRVLVDVPKQASPIKTPPFFASEIVMEIGKGDVKNPAVWVKDYEGRVGRIDEDNLEPINGAWGLHIDLTRFNQGIMSTIRKRAGYGKPPKKPKKLASKEPDPKAKKPDPKAKKPDPKAKTPDPKAKTSEPKVKKPDLKTKKPDPKAKTSDPKAKTPDPKAKTPDPKAKTPDTKATGKKRAASEPAGPGAKKVKTDTLSAA
ncbi:hypothetical protein EYC80_010910 [Monilinia laxa]|uniref:Uncharacterized protein n=1 Tax=Monilinia laxa TaxID=61186 RepID=A0A5N6JS63_MONLA|nr:hypothetical protein EYC80_010910 [Monilinia laxa]